MCRLICVESPAGFEIDEHLAALAAIAEHSVEYQGHGWGCAWRDDGRWRTHHSIRPIWEDARRPAGRSTLLVAHARSAFRDEGIRIENNMPFRQGGRVFAFNGELRGVRIREDGRIGAEKIFNFVQRFDRGDLLSALERAVGAIERRTRYVRAMNIVIAEPSRVCVTGRFDESPDYFQMQRCTVGDPRTAGALRIVCSERYPGDRLRGADWEPIPNGAAFAWRLEGRRGTDGGSRRRG